MPITMTELDDGRVLEVEVAGKLVRRDYEQFAPETDRLVKRWGKLALLICAVDFHGWDLGGLWEEIKWDALHFRKLDRVAVVGESHWQEQLVHMGQWLASGEVRYFERRDLELARAWVRQLRQGAI